MEKVQRQELRERFDEIVDTVDCLRAIIVYGSAVRKTRVEGSDIDILVFLDDTSEDFSNLAHHKARREAKKIESREEEFKLHIQPPKRLTHWWKLLIEGEPWAMTAVKYSQPIYDPEGLIDTLGRLSKDLEPSKSEERSINLYRRASEKLDGAVDNYKQETLESILEGVQNSGEILLKFKGESAPSKENLLSRLSDEFEIEQEYQNFYDRLLEESREADTSSISASELEVMRNKSLELIETLAVCFRNIAEHKRKEIAEECYQKSLEVCRKTLNKTGIDDLKNDEETLQKFREEYADEGAVSQEYFDMIQRIREERESELEKVSSEEIYKPLVQLKDFQAALKDSISELESYKEGKKTIQVEPINKFQDKVLDETDDIKAIWLLTIEDILDTDNVTLVVLKDMNADDRVESALENAREEITEEYSFKINTETVKLSDYWQDIRNTDVETFSELRESISLYDPEGLVEPIKKIVEEGDLEDTLESMMEEIQESPEKIVNPSQKAKLNALQKLYNSSVEMCQAALLKVGVSPPVQKKVPEEMQKHLVNETHLISEEDVKTIEKVIKMWKDFEHGQKESLDSKELEELDKELRKVSDDIGSLIKEEKI